MDRIHKTSDYMESEEKKAYLYAIRDTAKETFADEKHEKKMTDG